MLLLNCSTSTSRTVHKLKSQIITSCATAVLQKFFLSHMKIPLLTNTAYGVHCVRIELSIAVTLFAKTVK
jgi:hypothetical protein